MKKILILLLISFCLAFAGNLENEFKVMDFEQKEVLIKSYSIGEPLNMGYTLAAIAWQESSAGKYLINVNDPSAGVFHNNLYSVLRRHGLPETEWQLNLMAQKLINSIEFSAAEALSELEYWQSIHGKGQWILIWQSYNGGFSYREIGSDSYVKSYEYAQKIKNKIDFLANNGIFLSLKRRDSILKNIRKYYGN